ncbi:MAG: S8 family serine peptidase [Bacteroidota bacterium]
MRNVWLGAILLVLSSGLQAQEAVWLMLTDKGPQVSEQLAHPEHILSETARAMRAAKGINLTFEDLPVYPTYTAQIAATGLQIVGKSRWLNAVAVQGQPSQLQAANSLPFVNGQTACATFTTHSAGQEEVLNPDFDGAEAYGKAERQVEMLNLIAYHEKGMTGKGVRVAVFDAGFPGTDTIPVFKKMRDENRLLATYDFVENDPFVFHKSSHGTQVLSTIAAYLPGKMIGTAPDASFVLCRTENSGSERHVEEYNFMKAVEFADSVGVDIIHASLGYTKFDEGEGDYTYEDMDGNTAITTKAVDMAAARGILVTISAGNEGSSKWHYIAAPCDADTVLCVGSVDKYTKHSRFSSYGPTYDGRIKPDVVALGTRTTLASPRGTLTAGNGTSYAGPLMAGFVACLKQAHPESSHTDIIQAVRLSGDQAWRPDSAYGYGVPNALVADEYLSSGKSLDKVVVAIGEMPLRGKKPQTSVASSQVKFTPNPVSTVAVKGKKLSVATGNEAKIEEMVIMKGDQQVIIPTKNMKVKTTSAKIKTKYWLAGDYYITIKTDKYKEIIPFKIQ